MNIDLIKEAVVAWDGKFKPACDFVVIYNDGGNYAACSTPELTHEPILFTRAQFEEVAKRMGFINGYKWGVEYTTDGEKPDLPDDVVVQVKILKGDAFYGERPAHLWYWGKVYSFRITDERYKPEPEEGPAESAAAFFERRSPTVYGTREPLPDAKPVEPEQPKSWYEAGELPPVGIECEIGWSGSDSKVWYVGVVTYRSEKYTIIVYGDGSEICYSESELDEVKFRPLRTKREKTIVEACKVMKSTHHTVVSNLALLYDAGLLRLPDNKKND